VRIRRASLAELEPTDPDERCDCGVLLAVHPPLPKPLPWEHGRPCSRPVPDGKTWDGRDAGNRAGVPRGPYGPRTPRGAV